MATSSSLLSEDQFLCCICLNVFTDPVTIPCGHNFCKSCITQHWDINVQCQCPMCKKVLNTRPELHVNTFISDMVARLRKSAQNKASSSSSEQQQVKPGEVVCDVCTETKLKALKSCLVCLTSYCETHLELHHRLKGLKRHKLIDPVENLEDRMCQKHQRRLELFCKTDQLCVCHFCTKSDHKSHVFLPLKEERERKRAKLERTEAHVQLMIQERRVKIEQIKQSVKLSNEDADRETAASVQVFTALIQSAKRGLAQIIDIIEEKQKTAEKQAEGFIQELEEEISELMKRRSELEQLSHTEDHLLFLQSLPSMNFVPRTKDWTEVRVHSSYEGTVTRAVAQLEEMLSQQVKKLTEAEVTRVQQYEVDVTLDPETAHPNLMLSDDGKGVSHGDETQNLPDNPKRFSLYSVLGKQGFTSGRFYYEVQVTGKTDWMLGVVTASVYRKSLPTKDDDWVIQLVNESEYKVVNSKVPVSLKSYPEKVGVFVDYEEGLVSFYDVHAAVLIYSFTGCKFTRKLYPYFNPCDNRGGVNSAPLIICPVSTQ